VSLITCCRYSTGKDTDAVYPGGHRVLFEYNKFRLLNELDCLEQTIVNRQQELREMDEVLEQHRTDLAAVQLEVLRGICITLVNTTVEFSYTLSGLVFQRSVCISLSCAALKS